MEGFSRPECVIGHANITESIVWFKENNKNSVYQQSGKNNNLNFLSERDLLLLLFQLVFLICFSVFFQLVLSCYFICFSGQWLFGLLAPSVFVFLQWMTVRVRQWDDMCAEVVTLCIYVKWDSETTCVLR